MFGGDRARHLPRRQEAVQAYGPRMKSDKGISELVRWKSGWHGSHGWSLAPSVGGLASECRDRSAPGRTGRAGRFLVATGTWVTTVGCAVIALWSRQHAPATRLRCTSGDVCVRLGGVWVGSQDRRRSRARLS